MHPYYPHDPFGMVVGILAIVCAASVLTQLIKSLANRGASAQALEAYEKRLARVEVAIDDLTVAIGRVSEGQQFLTNVLSERGVVPALPPRS
jgi:hypothetical protein